MDGSDRELIKEQGEARINSLESAGVVAVATTFVDNSGIARVKTTPLHRLGEMAAWGVGFTPSFDRIRFDDVIALSGTGVEPVGDLRMIPDLERLVVLTAQPGWAWAPADRFLQSGDPHPQDSRLLLKRITGALHQHGIAIRCGFEIEWVVSAAGSDGFVPGVHGAAYGMDRLVALSDYARDLLVALRQQGVEVEQFHPEYAVAQFELSTSPEPPVGAADTSVLVRMTIKAVGAKYGLRTSFSPKVDVSGVGSGGHVHLSAWRGPGNLMAGGDAPAGMTAEGASFMAGILSHLPGLLAVGCPGPASYLRLIPSHWSGDYACWGVENREAAVRFVTGPPASSAWSANMEVKCFDLLANPYLLLAGLLATGQAGLSESATLPDPVSVDPAVLSESELSQRGIRRLPTSLSESLAAFLADATLTSAFGADLVASIAAIRKSEIDLFANASDEEIAAAVRWTH